MPGPPETPSGEPMTAVNLRCIEGMDLQAIPVKHYDGCALQPAVRCGVFRNCRIPDSCFGVSSRGMTCSILFAAWPGFFPA